MNGPTALVITVIAIGVIAASFVAECERQPQEHGVRVDTVVKAERKPLSYILKAEYWNHWHTDSFKVHPDSPIDGQGPWVGGDESGFRIYEYVRMKTDTDERIQFMRMYSAFGRTEMDTMEFIRYE